jgi:hypothetical protein
LNQIGRKAWQSVELPICPMRVYLNGLALNVTDFFETLPKRGQELRVRISRSRADDANDRRRLLLAARCHRPRRRYAAEQHNELAPTVVEHGPGPGATTER